MPRRAPNARGIRTASDSGNCPAPALQARRGRRGRAGPPRYPAPEGPAGHGRKGACPNAKAEGRRTANAGLFAPY